MMKRIYQNEPKEEQAAHDPSGVPQVATVQDPELPQGPIGASRLF